MRCLPARTAVRGIWFSEPATLFADPLREPLARPATTLPCPSELQPCAVWWVHWLVELLSKHKLFIFISILVERVSIIRTRDQHVIAGFH